MQCLILILAILVELGCSAMGLPLPATTIAGFYFAVTTTWRKNFLLLSLALLFLDLCLCRPCPVSLIQVPLLQLMGFIWKSQGNTHDGMPQLVPGLFIGLLTCLTASLQLIVFDGHLSLRLALQIIAVTCVSTPIFLTLLDHIAKQFGYPLYADSSHYYHQQRHPTLRTSEYHE